MKNFSDQTQIGVTSIASTIAVVLLVTGFMGMAQHINASLL